MLLDYQPSVLTSVLPKHIAELFPAVNPRGIFFERSDYSKQKDTIGAPSGYRTLCLLIMSQLL